MMRLLSYLYFLRFSLLMWLWMPFLVLADRFALSAMTRGIVALGLRSHFVMASFVIVLTGWIALLSARIVCAYGEERFGIAPPRVWMVNHGMSVWTFVGAQVPGAILLLYIVIISRLEEGRSVWFSLVFVLLGAALASCVWLLLACIYYWMYLPTRPQELTARLQDIRKPALAATLDDAKSFIIPWKFLNDLQRLRPSSYLLVITAALGRMYWFLRLRPGFINQKKQGYSLVHSGHTLAFLVWLFLALFYLILWDFTSPVYLPRVHLILVSAIVAGVVIWIISAWIYPQKQRPSETVSRTVGHATNGLLMVVFFSPLWVPCLVVLLLRHSRDGLPVLASISILLALLLWMLVSLAFILDRFRVPVLVLVFVVYLSLGGFRMLLKAPDHEVLVTKAQQPIPLLTPAEIVSRFEKQDTQSFTNPKPMIIVTATGGGIHAAAWTSRMLGMMERSFATQNSRVPFHDSILLMSTVSGGSVGTVSWAAEYLREGHVGDQEATNWTRWRTEQMTRAAQCSSLEGVAWGLSYGDLLRMAALTGKYDRGWALQESFRRNRHFRPCGTAMAEHLPEETLGDLATSLASGSRHTPAFSFNTTVAETGDRFLLANYRVTEGSSVSPVSNGRSELIPAASFLDVYGPDNLDLPLSSAARLSANFPYVSPMPAVPLSKHGYGYHFGDGGYFDNDGTATAIEFLLYAFGRQTSENHVGVSPRSRPLQILVLEIRDSPDLDIYNPDSIQAQRSSEKQNNWGALGQVMGPLQAFYQAGHASMTLRNRRELCVLEKALDHQVSIKHIVLDYDTSYLRAVGEIPGCRLPLNRDSSVMSRDGDSATALSWHLTLRQQHEICRVAATPQIARKIQSALEWYKGSSAPTSAAASVDVCTERE